MPMQENIAPVSNEHKKAYKLGYWIAGVGILLQAVGGFVSGSEYASHSTNNSILAELGEPGLLLMCAGLVYAAYPLAKTKSPKLALALLAGIPLMFIYSVAKIMLKFF